MSVEVRPVMLLSTMIAARNYPVFCDGRVMQLSEMRELVRADMERFAKQDAEREKERLARLRASILENSRARWQQEFSRWEEQCQYPRREGAEERGLRRKMRDEQAMIKLMRRVEARHRFIKRGAPEACNAVLDQINDHDYIEWMFRCGEKGYKAPT